MARTYTDEERARVFIELQIHDGNIKRVAREAGVPETTVRNWKDTWEREGVPPEIQELGQKDAHDFADEASEVRGLALKQLRSRIQKGEGTLKDLSVTVGILTDKIDRARGISKREPDQAPRGELPSPEILAELARGVVRGALEAVSTRDAEIEDAEYVEQPQQGLPSGSSDARS